MLTVLAAVGNLECYTFEVPAQYDMMPAGMFSGNWINNIRLEHQQNNE